MWTIFCLFYYEILKFKQFPIRVLYYFTNLLLKTLVTESRFSLLVFSIESQSQLRGKPNKGSKFTKENYGFIFQKWKVKIRKTVGHHILHLDWRFEQFLLKRCKTVPGTCKTDISLCINNLTDRRKLNQRRKGAWMKVWKALCVLEEENRSLNLQ